MSYSPVFSAQFIVHKSGDPYSAFEVPSDMTAVIRDVTAWSTAGAFWVTVTIRNSLIAPQVTAPVAQGSGVPAYGQWQGRVVVAGGGEIGISVVEFIGDPDVYVGGYLLRNTIS